MGRFIETERRPYDLIVVGGGIIGAGVARDAALRGLSVALFEKGDFGGGTTAGSTRLIHGGLRYLEMLDFRLVRLDLRERETLLRIAPHLVKPLRFFVPFYQRSLFYRLKLRAGMILYDFLSYDKSLPRHRMLSAAELKTLEPNLSEANLQGAAAYYDAQAFSPERLCLENILDARANGAHVYNYAEVTKALYDDGQISGVSVRDVLDERGTEITVNARVIVNAAGPWFDRVSGALTKEYAKRIRTTKGIHLTCPQLNNDALVLFSNIDERLFFVIPWLGHSWIGTTDTDYTDDPVAATAEKADADYLLDSVRAILPPLADEPIYFSNAGVRALVLEEGSASSVSRMHRISDEAKRGASNLISIMGGKITGYRAIAEEAIDLVCAKLGVKKRARTGDVNLPGARPTPSEMPTASLHLDDQTKEHLVFLYGTRAAEVCALAATNARLSEPLADGYPDICAQVVHAVRHEHCLRLNDFMLRRTVLGFHRDQGRRAAERVAALMAGELGWSAERCAAELQDFTQYLAQTHFFQHK